MAATLLSCLLVQSVKAILVGAKHSGNVPLHKSVCSYKQWPEWDAKADGYVRCFQDKPAIRGDSDMKFLEGQPPIFSIRLCSA